MIANLHSYRLLKWVLEWMNRCILKNIELVTFASFEYSRRSPLPLGRPLIIVSNHQSMYDVPMHIVQFPEHSPRFISKRELARGIPSISFALRHNGSAIIDRGDRLSAIPEIQRIGEIAEQRRYAVCLFPEGTRARNGVMKPFKPGGLATLLKTMPSALIVPVANSGSWELLRYNLLPIPVGVRVKFQVLEPVEPRGISADVLSAQLEARIREVVENEQEKELESGAG